MRQKQYTGEELAKAMHLDMTDEEMTEDIRTRKWKRSNRIISDGFWSTLWRKIWPSKIFYIKFANGHGVIIMADDEEDACIQSAYHFGEGRHHCQNPFFNKSCEKCKKIFDDDADKINH